MDRQGMSERELKETKVVDGLGDNLELRNIPILDLRVRRVVRP